MPRQLAWEKAEQEELKLFRENLQQRLETLEQPGSLECHDIHCNTKTATTGTHVFFKKAFAVDLRG